MQIHEETMQSEATFRAGVIVRIGAGNLLHQGSIISGMAVLGYKEI